MMASDSLGSQLASSQKRSDIASVAAVVLCAASAQQPIKMEETDQNRTSVHRKKHTLERNSLLCQTVHHCLFVVPTNTSLRVVQSTLCASSPTPIFQRSCWKTASVTNVVKASLRSSQLSTLPSGSATAVSNLVSQETHLHMFGTPVSLSSLSCKALDFHKCVIRGFNEDFAPKDSDPAATIHLANAAATDKLTGKLTIASASGSPRRSPPGPVQEIGLRAPRTSSQHATNCLVSAASAEPRKGIWLNVEPFLVST